MSNLDDTLSRPESPESYIQHNPHRASFTTIYNSCINDTRLGQKELALLIYMLSKPPKWKIRTPELSKRFGLHVESIRKQLKNLEELGYTKRVRTRNADGSWGEIVTYVNDTPEYTPDKDSTKPNNQQPHTDLPSTVKTSRGKSRAYSKERDSSKKETNIKKQQQQGEGDVVAVVASFDLGLVNCLKSLGGTDDSVRRLLEGFPADYVWTKVKAQSTKKHNNPFGWIVSACKGNWLPSVPAIRPNQRPASNYQYHVSRHISESPGEPVEQKRELSSEYLAFKEKTAALRRKQHE